MDLLWSYPAAMRIVGNVERQETGRWLNNPAENSHPPFRRRERAMAKFRSLKSLQKFTRSNFQFTIILTRSIIFTAAGSSKPTDRPSLPNGVELSSEIGAI